MKRREFARRPLGGGAPAEKRSRKIAPANPAPVAADLRGRLSENFCLSEFVFSQNARRAGLDNTPPPAAIENMRGLCKHVLQPFRDRIGRAVTITSGYRSPEVNRLSGGAKKSPHMEGRAADIEVFSEGFSTLGNAREIERMGLDYDTLILEYHDEGEPFSGWVHVSWRPGGGRRLKFIAEPGKPLRLVETFN